jgi:predicted phage-related endonuclease
MERKGFIGGSDVVKIQDPSNWFELWEIKTGRRESADLSDVLAVQMGVNTEDFNIKWFFKMMGDLYGEGQSLKQNTYHNNEFFVPLKGTLDLVNIPKKYILECKHTYEGNSMHRVRELYMPQVQTYMYLSGLPKCYLSVFFGNNKYDCLEIEYNHEYFEEIMKRVIQFWSYVKDDEAPPMGETKLKLVPTDKIVVDGKVAKNMVGNNYWTSMVDQYIENKPSHELFEAAKKEILNTIESNERSVYCDRLEVVRSKSGRRNINLINNKEDVA